MGRKLKVLSLFSGIGAYEKALERLNIDYELINYCEIDKYASKSYSIIHNVSEDLNLGDITKIDIDKLRDFDLLTHGSPCQDFSIAGLGLGGDKDSGTRSSLMWNTVEIIKHKKPKYVIWENVKGVLSKKHKHNFDKYISELNELGYVNYYQILNSKYFNVPQNRERVFVVSILGEHNEYEFPSGVVKNNKTIMDVLEQNIQPKYYLSQEFIKKFVPNSNFERLHTILDKSPIEVGYIKKSKYGKKHQSNTVYDANNLCGALFAQEYKSPRMFMIKTEEDLKIRRLTPKECWRLMGFDDLDVEKCIDANISNTQLYKQAGNSIVVNVLEHIFRNLLLNNI